MGSGKGQAKRIKSITVDKSVGEKLLKDVSSNKNKKSSFTPLIPEADEWVDNDFNILLIGPHGTGKTAELVNLAERKGLNLKYFSASTLDPFTDIVGVPVPRQDDNGEDFLKFVRDKSLNEAEIIFFDEINRAHPKTMNAIFEIIQFGTINGEPLPNLKACWAAMNPADEEYSVEDIDPALMDRFDAYKIMNAKPSVQYYVSRGIRKEVAQAIISWASAHDSNKNKDLYLSPRRLEKIGILYEKTGKFESALPPFAKFDTGKLSHMLKEATMDPEEKKRRREAERLAKEEQEAEFKKRYGSLSIDKAKKLKTAQEQGKTIPKDKLKPSKTLFKRNAEILALQIETDLDGTKDEIQNNFLKLLAKPSGFGTGDVKGYLPLLMAFDSKILEAIAAKKQAYSLYSYSSTILKDPKAKKDKAFLKRIRAAGWDVTPKTGYYRTPLKWPAGV